VYVAGERATPPDTREAFKAAMAELLA